MTLVFFAARCNIDAMLRSPCVLSALLLSVSASGQDFRQSIPRLPEPTTPTIVPLPPSADPAGLGDTILPALVGVRFFTDTSGVTGSAVSGLDITAVPVLDTPAFRKRIEQDLGRPASLASLQALAQAAALAFRDADRPLVDIAIPAQDITNGSVAFLVREFRVGDVVIEGNRHFKTDRLRGMIRVSPGETLDQRQLVEDINWISINPFRRVDVLYRRADAPLTTDVIVRVTDRPPWRVYAGFENNGTPSTGRERWSAGVNWGNAFGADGQLAYQYTTSSDLFEGRGGLDPRFQAHGLTWVQPLRNRHSLVLFGTYQRVVPRIDPLIGLTGENWQLSPRYVIPLRSRSLERAQITLGYDFKQTDNNLLFGGTSVSSQATQIHQAVVDVSISRRWVGGLFSAENRFVFSPGGIGGRNTDDAFQPGPDQSGTPFARAQYAYWRGTISQTFPLGASGAEAITRLTGQVSTANLLPSEQLPITGPGFVRAYDPNSIIGTRGVIFNQELWGPALPIFGSAGRLQLGGYFDAGIAGNKDRLPGEPEWTRATSIGAMAKWSIAPYIDFRADFGTQLRLQPGRSTRGNLGFVSLTVGY